MASTELAPKFAPFFGMAGISFAMIFGCVGAAYGTAKSGIGISGVGTFRPDLIMKSLIPVVMSGIIAVYSLVIAVLIAGDMGPPPGQNYSLFTGFMHLACGLSVGLTGLAAGYAIGVVGDMVSLKLILQFDEINWVLGCPLIYAPIEDLRRYGTNIDLWRGAGFIWAYRRFDTEY
ncbi:MAG: v-type proton ATPase 16 kDa proteolipid subunit 2 [Candelina mexicana]|nr:MAG: v-type proton ATPase 16 kDa proteolipid subunit 2 [Candelina mexicana]